MSTRYRLGRSLGIASIALILVAGVAFAHDAIVNAPRADGSPDLVTAVEPVVPATEVEDQQTTEPERDEIDDVVGTTPDVEEPAETQDPAEVADPVKPAKVEQHAAKPAKAQATVHKASADSSNNDNEDDNDADEADDNDQHDGDHQSGDDQGGDQGDSDNGGDD